MFVAAFVSFFSKTAAPHRMLGPNYSFADELRTPSELGIGRDGSFDGIMRAVGGVNYYTDAIGFGESTMLAKTLGMHQRPMGIRFFVKNGLTCSNGADMYDYIDTTTKGLHGRVGNEVKKTLGVNFAGLAPGMIESSAEALNPVPLFKAASASGYPRCKKVTLPVGDGEGRIKSGWDPKNVWITEPYSMVNGAPHQTRWVLDKYVSMEEYDADPKTEETGTYPEKVAAAVTAGAATAKTAVGVKKEGFANPTESKVAAGVLFAALVLGLVAWKSSE